jgi:hypothetical protein
MIAQCVCGGRGELRETIKIKKKNAKSMRNRRHTWCGEEVAGHRALMCRTP